MQSTSCHITLSSPFIDRILILRDTGRDNSGIITYCSVSNGAVRTVETSQNQISEETLQYIRQASDVLDALNAINLSKLGRTIGLVAFPNSVFDAFSSDLSLAQNSGKRLRIHIDDYDSKVSGLPWEFMWFDNIGFISINPNCSVVRTFQSGSQRQDNHRAPIGDQLDLLIVWADPGHPYQPLDATSQIDTIVKLTSEPLPGALNVRTLLPRRHTRESNRVATLNNLYRIQSERPAHIIFFLTHGDFDVQLQQGLIVLEGPDTGGPYHLVTANELEKTINSAKRPYVIIFDGCRSANRGSSGTGKSIAEAVAKHGHSVIGMQYTWPAAACHPFWREFFRMLTVPRPLDECIFSGRDFLYRLINGLPDDSDRTASGPKQTLPIPMASRSVTVGDWGFPVMYRSYLPLSNPVANRSCPSVTDKRTPDLDHLTQTIGDELMERLLRLDRQDITCLVDILSKSKTYDPTTIHRLSCRDDTLRVLLAGADDPAASQVVNSSPVWFTNLLDPPRKISWDYDSARKTFSISLWSIKAGEIVNVVTADTFIEITQEQGNQIARGEYIHWEVKRAEARLQDPAVVSGIFQVLPPAQASLIIQYLPSIHDLLPGIERDMQFAACCLHWYLFDDILREFSREQMNITATEQFARTRLVAHVYSAMQDQLSKRHLGNQEGIWAAAAANYHVDESYRLLTGQHR